MMRHGVWIGSVSGGVFPPARSGLLDGASCSVHWCYEATFAAVFDLMLHFIKEKLGSEVSTEVACWFQHPMVRGQGVRQMVMYAKDTIPQIANYVGYATSSPMVSHYFDIFGIIPKEEREKINLFRVEGNLSKPSATGHAIAVDK